MNKPYSEACEQVRQQFKDAGISVAEWARANGFTRVTVVDVLHGRTVGHRGEGHRVAVALGLKQGVVVDVKKFKPAPASVRGGSAGSAAKQPKAAP